MTISVKLCALAVLFIGTFKLSDANSKEVEKPLIDFLLLEYLSVEQSLWYKINSRSIDKTELYSNIRDEHQRFISSDFGTVTSQQNPLTTLQQVNSLFYNASVFLNSNNIALEDVVFLFRNKISDRAARLSADVFNIASRANFWENGKNSLQHCRQSESSLITIESEFHLIYNYYKDVRAALLKTYILTQLSHMLSSINNINGGNQISPQVQDVREDYSQRIALLKRNVKNLLKIAKRDSWLCDKSPTLNGEYAYEQITKFLQGYVDHELNFNQEDTCQQSCSDFNNTKHIRCADKTMCANETDTEALKLSVCNGQIRDCSSIDNDDAELCLTESRTRRYHYVKFNNGQMNGPQPSETCSAIRHSKTWRRWFVKCSSCYCLCDDPEQSERHFSLHEVVSDVEQNKVVTGVRIVKRNGVIQLAISQRTLLPFGQTDESEPDTWKESINQFAVTDRSAIDGIDYYTLTYENRSINLDDLVVPQGKLVTGVRFHTLNGHIILQIRATDFNYFNGRLENITYNPWVMNPQGGQYKIEIPKKFNPISSTVPDVFIPNHLPHSYVEFGPTDFKNDAGQLTIPFIETIPLESKNPLILGGVGLTYKTNDESAGFIGVKTISYDFSIADLEPDDEYDYID